MKILSLKDTHLRHLAEAIVQVGESGTCTFRFRVCNFLCFMLLEGLIAYWSCT